MRGAESSEQQGWVLPATLFGITLMLGTIRLLSLETTGGIRLYADIRQSNTIRQRAVRELASIGEPKPLCEKLSMNIEETRLSYEVCGERRTPFMVAPPTAHLPLSRVDYDAIFTNALPCPSTPINPTTTDSESVKAAKDCAIPPLLQGGLITRENLRGEATRVIASPSHGSIIASPGAIFISGALGVESDLVIVAGGDIEISAIITPPQQSSKITIISALGAIRIGFVSPGISMIAAGRSVLELPETAQSPPFPLPPQRRHGIVGIRPVWE
jgi:hypothetical protein